MSGEHGDERQSSSVNGQTGRRGGRAVRPHDISPTTTEGANTDGSPYTSGYYLVKYDHDGVTKRAVMRLNLPDPTGDVPRLVILISGANGDGVKDVEGTAATRSSGGAMDPPAGILASGAALPARYDAGRNSEPVMTLTFQPPGRGNLGPGPITRSGGDPDMVDWAVEHPGATENTTGDDYYGPMALEALLACIEGALAVSEIYYGAPCDRIYVASFSNGACLAAQLVADNSTYQALAWVDMEGPTDSFEQTVSSQATDEAGEDGLSTTISYDDWYAGRALKGEIFVESYAYWYRAPMSVLEELDFSYSLGGAEQPVLDNVNITAEDVAEGLAFWPARETALYIAQRTCPYIRVQGEVDHVQPTTYENLHAVHALIAAADAGTDAYQAITPADPVEFDSTSVTLSDPDSFPVWPSFSGVLHGVDKLPLVDALRWAFDTFG